MTELTSAVCTDSPAIDQTPPGKSKGSLDWGKPTQRWVDVLTLAEARGYLAEGTHFAPGSMAPKIEACIEFLEHTGGEAIITSPANMELALSGGAGTRIVA